MAHVLPVLAFGVGLWLIGASVAVAASQRLGPGQALCGFPLGVAVIALVSLTQVLVPFRFGPGSVGLAWLSVLACAAVAGLVSRRWRAPEVRSRPFSGARAALIVALALLGSFLGAVLVLWVAGGRTLETVSQTWDAFFDTNAIRWGYESGDLAPSRISDFTRFEPVNAWYPTVFHSLGALFMHMSGSDAVVASNVAAATLAGALWPSTVALGARTILGPTRLVTLGALVLQAGFLGMPWAPLGWGVLWATTVAATMTPLVIAGFARTVGRTHEAPTRHTRAKGLALLVAGVLGILAYHPRVLVIVAALLFALWCWLWLEDLWQHRRTPGRRRLVDACVLAASLIVLLLVVLFVGRHSFEARRWPVDNPWWRELLNYLVNAPVTGIPQLITAALVVLGAVLLARRRRWHWMLVLLLAAIAIDVVTAVTQGMTVFNGITRFWYNDRYRTIVLPAFPAVLVALVAVRALVDRWNLPAVRARCRLTMAALAALIVAWGSASASGYLSGTYGKAAQDPAASVVSPQERAFFAEVARIVPRDAKILNNPHDGSAFLYAYANRWPVFMVAGGVRASTINGYALRTTMNTELPVLVCRRFLADDIRYVLTGGQTYHRGVILPDPAPAMEVPDGFPILRKVASGADFTLWEVHGCPIT